MDYAVVGLQWGDEGKGKIVDCLINHALPFKVDCVVRFNGGNNAGHTIVKNGKTYKLSLIPSGVLTQNTANYISRGVAFDPLHFIKELAYLRENGVEVRPYLSFDDPASDVHTTSYLHIDMGCPVITPVHRYVDEMENKSIGTTCRGIGPAYSDYYARRAIRVEDLLLTDEAFKEKFPDCSEATFSMVRDVRDKILPYVDPYFNFNVCEDERVLFEGAQGMMLDVFHGTYPYVTSSPANPAFASVVTGYHPKNLTTIGVTKAYATRVGSGPFPTELFDEDGEALRRIGGEIGVTTGRARRCGWFDAPIARYAVRVNGLTDFFLTKLDVLTGWEKIPVCVAYEIDGKRVEELPASQTDFHHAKPIYEYLAGWTEDISGARKLSDLPKNAQDYVAFLEKISGAPMSAIGVGPGRDQTIVVKDFI